MSASEHLFPPSSDKLQLLGAALLAAGRPVSTEALVRLIGVPPPQCEALLTQLSEALAPLGMATEQVAGGHRLIVPAHIGPALEPLLAPPPLPALSASALEVLAVVAYRQPVTRAEIEAMRGGSAGTLATLLERGLVHSKRRSSAIGSPRLYETTEKFLLEFGLGGLGDLPPLGEDGFAELLRG